MKLTLDIVVTKRGRKIIHIILTRLFEIKKYYFYNIEMYLHMLVYLYIKMYQY